MQCQQIPQLGLTTFCESSAFLPSAEAFKQESGSPRMVSTMYAAEKVALLGT